MSDQQYRERIHALVDRIIERPALMTIYNFIVRYYAMKPERFRGAK